jgi:hypothetical protein
MLSKQSSPSEPQVAMIRCHLDFSDRYFNQQGAEVDKQQPWPEELGLSQSGLLLM